VRPIPELARPGFPPEVLLEAKPLCALKVTFLLKLGLKLEEEMLQNLKMLVSRFVRHLARGCKGEVD
jgi:hypothetical protein